MEVYTLWSAETTVLPKDTQTYCTGSRYYDSIAADI